MRDSGVNPSEEDKPARDDSDDLDIGLEPGAIPAHEDIREGDEEKDEETDFPSAMPPGA
jgi:hypothetical protein